MPSAAYCSTCHAPVKAGSRYCGACGADVRAEQEQVSTLEVLEGKARRRVPGQEELAGLLATATAGEYEILGELGRGGMATVFLAREVALERKVAIKVMSPILLYGEGMAERFMREARTAGGLSHPHIIPIHAVRETRELLYFVMKYVEGRPLDSILKELGGLPIRMAQVILTQVGSALAHAHRRHVIHRDIKPANLMIDEDGWAVVTDFGIAKVEDQSHLTKTGAAVGTPYYMSPEQCAGHGIGPATDQYSLGIVGYEILAGRTPFHGGGVQEVMRAHFVEPPPPIESLRPDCPPGLARVILRMLAKTPEDRFPTMDDAVQAIGAAPLEKDDPIRTQMVELARSGQRRVARASGHLPARASRAAAVARPSAAAPRPSSAHRPVPEGPRGSSGRHSGGPERPRNPTPARSRPVLPVRRRRQEAIRTWAITLAVGVVAAVAGWVAVRAVAGGTAPPAATTTDSTARVRVASRYDGTRLLLDGKPLITIGPTPVTVAIPARMLTLRAVRNGCRPHELVLTLRPRELKDLGRLDPICP